MSASFDLPILMYHHVTVGREGLASSAFTITRDNFVSQLDHLARKGYTTISFRELLAAIYDAAPLPPKPVLLTFDDGYASFADVVMPELVGRGMKSTVFVVVNALGGFNDWDTDTGRPLVPLMDADAIRKVIDAGMEIGVHGLGHEDLRALDDARVEREAREAREQMTRRFGVLPVVFCYPYGRYEARLIPLLTAAGYRAAVSIYSEQRTVTEDPFAMRRIYVHQADGPLRFSLKLSPMYLRWVAFRQRRAGDACH